MTYCIFTCSTNQASPLQLLVSKLVSIPKRLTQIFKINWNDIWPFFYWQQSCCYGCDAHLMPSWKRKMQTLSRNNFLFIWGTEIMKVELKPDCGLVVPVSFIHSTLLRVYFGVSNWNKLSLYVTSNELSLFCLFWSGGGREDCSKWIIDTGCQSVIKPVIIAIFCFCLVKLLHWQDQVGMNVVHLRLWLSKQQYQQ